MRKCQKIWILQLLLSLYLVSCGAHYSSSFTVTPTYVKEDPSQETTTPVAQIKLEKLHEWHYLNQYADNARWAPHGDQFVVSFFDTVKMFNVNTFQEIWSIPSKAPAYSASAPTFSLNGRRLYLYVRLRGPQEYDSQTGELLTEVVSNYQDPCLLNDANGAVISLDGHTLFLNVEDNREKQVDFTEVQKWDVSSQQCEVYGKLEGHARSIDISSDGKFLSASTGKNTSVSNNSISEDGEIIIWNMDTGERICSIHNNGAFARFNPLESRLLVPNPSLNKLSYWDIKTCSIAQDIIGQTSYYDFTFSPDGKIIAIWDSGSISLLDADSGVLLKEIKDPSLENAPLNYLQSRLIFSPDGRYLLSVLNHDPLEVTVILWNIET